MVDTIPISSKKERLFTEKKEGERAVMRQREKRTERSPPPYGKEKGGGGEALEELFF